MRNAKELLNYVSTFKFRLTYLMFLKLILVFLGFVDKGIQKKCIEK